jgi:Ca2+/Na+ antiporter
MDGMDMSDMGGMGMDMGSSMFRTTDEAFSHDFWFIIAALTACVFLFKTLTWAEASWRYAPVPCPLSRDTN